MRVLHPPLRKQILRIVVLLGVGATATTSLAQGIPGLSDPNDLLNPPIVKLYQLDCAYLSLDPNRPMESYRSHGSNMLSAGATLGNIWVDEVRRFQTLITSQMRDKRFLVRINIRPNRSDTVTQARTIEIDLSDLKARSVEVARNVDGRIYWINMTPSIRVIDQKAKRLRESALKLTSWNLSGSPVIVNDTTYAGNMGVNDAVIAWVEYPSLGRVEFSLVPFKGAEVAGVLSEGHLHLRHGNQSLEIYGVQNGEPAMRLPGGPYMVWAKWSESSEPQPVQEIPSSAEEFIQLVKAQFAENGQTPPDDETLQAAYEKLKTMKLLPLTQGGRGIGRNERVE